MADNIYNNCFVTKKEIAWHKLGTVRQELTAELAIADTKADFQVIKEKIYISRDNGNIEIPGYYSTTRTDNNIPLGIVGSDYKVIQNREVFTFFDDLVGMEHGYYETAGILGKGEVVFVSMKFPNNEFEVIKGDNIEDYIVITNSHDGKSSLKVLFTPVRVVCNNTLNMALANSKCSYSVRHSGDIRSKMNELQRIIRSNHSYINDVKQHLQHLSKISISDIDAKSIIVETFTTPEQHNLFLRNNYNYDGIEEISTRTKNIINDCLNYTNNGIGQQQAVNTGYWLVNGINGYYNNFKSYTKEETRFKNMTETEGKKNTEFVINKLLTLS